MKKIHLGKSDLLVAPIAFGGNVFGWTINEKTSFTLLDAFVEEGFNFIDTADVYSRWAPGNKGGESETIIGNWMKLRGNRSEVILATKVGMDMGQGKLDISRKHIIKSVEDSLHRLQTDYIDLYQSHKDDNTTPVEETLETYGQLVKEGKVKWIGASNFTAPRLKASLDASAKHGYPRYETLQPLYNLYSRHDFEKELQPLCVEHGISTITYSSLASGFLTGKYRSEADFNKSVRGGGMSKYLDARGIKILSALDKVSEKYNTTQAAVALAWLMSRPSVAAPIASATNKAQLDSLLKAAELNLDKEALDLLNEASK